jgi:hypothetical protein
MNLVHGAYGTVSLCACMLMTGVNAVAVESYSLSDVLEQCKGDEAGCLTYFKNQLSYAEEFEFACPPPGLSKDEAAKKLLTVLRETAAADTVFAKRTSVDAQIAANSALWPC